MGKCDNKETPPQLHHGFHGNANWTSKQAIADLKKGDDVLRRARELLPQLFLLRCDPHRAIVGVADARHNAPLGDHGYSSESEVSMKHGGQGEGRLTGGTKHCCLSLSRRVFSTRNEPVRGKCPTRAWTYHGRALRQNIHIYLVFCNFIAQSSLAVHEAIGERRPSWNVEQHLKPKGCDGNSAHLFNG